jgi:hypothetical protein
MTLKPERLLNTKTWPLLTKNEKLIGMDDISLPPIFLFQFKLVVFISLSTYAGLYFGRNINLAASAN